MAAVPAELRMGVDEAELSVDVVESVLAARAGVDFFPADVGVPLCPLTVFIDC